MYCPVPNPNPNSECEEAEAVGGCVLQIVSATSIWFKVSVRVSGGVGFRVRERVRKNPIFQGHVIYNQVR